MSLKKTPQGFKCNVTINGHKIRRILSKDRAKAQRIYEEMIEVGRAKRRGGIAYNMSWDYFQAEYLRKSKLGNPKTHNQNSRAFQLINDVVHVNLLENMTPELLDKAQTRLKEKNVGPHAIARAVRAILTAMRTAEDFKYVQMQNWRIVKYLIGKGRIDFYELERLFELLKKLEGPFRTSGFLMGRAGLRPGELLHIEWRDVQFDNNRILFQSKPEFNWKIKADKKLDKVRIIPMYPDLRAYLWSIRKDSGFVLEPPCARRVDSFGKVFKRALVETKVPTYAHRPIIPYTLRHSFASHLAQAGKSDLMIQQLMGHESIEMVKVYSHLRPVDMQRAVNFSHKMQEISEKTVSTLCPPLNPIQPETVLLGTLDPEIQRRISSSEILENSH